jgi:hypothetical protein|tara:strand:- start:579 stop:857 length:279 start_codon:yes stop_codon:yes gene_type:complete
MPLDKNGNKILYKPWPSKAKGKKFSVYVKGSNGNTKKINFGAKGMDDWRSGTATDGQRKSYKARASGIRNKQGQLTYKLKDTANYWSYHYLW